jgi:hypothetical protein
MTAIVKQDTLGFIVQSDNINEKAVQRVTQYLPELIEKTKSFGSQNTTTTLSMMTLTMLGGQSPYRMLRQILAEVERRKGALSESQVSHAKLVHEIERLRDKTDPIQAAKYRKACVQIQELEQKINGGFKDMAVLCDAYVNIKERNGIQDWDEVAFEAEEKRHHVRRCFELVYRNLIDGGRVGLASMEYMQQFGVHAQTAKKEVLDYIQSVDFRINQGEILHSNDLEDFLDRMAKKYEKGADLTSERIFGKKNIANHDFMYKTVRD